MLGICFANVLMEKKKKKNNFTHTHIFFPDVPPFTASVCLPGIPSYLLGEHY